MSAKISPEIKASLVARIRDLALAEVAGEVSRVYGFTLPEISEKRIAERDDEPQRTLDSIQEYVNQIKSVDVESIEIDETLTPIERYSGCLCTIASGTVRYNGSQSVSKFRTIWVLHDGVWYTTSIGKIHGLGW